MGTERTHDSDGQRFRPAAGDAVTVAKAIILADVAGYVDALARIKDGDFVAKASNRRQDQARPLSRSPAAGLDATIGLR